MHAFLIAFIFPQSNHIESPHPSLVSQPCSFFPPSSIHEFVFSYRWSRSWHHYQQLDGKANLISWYAVHHLLRPYVGIGELHYLFFSHDVWGINFLTSATEFHTRMFDLCRYFAKQKWSFLCLLDQKGIIKFLKPYVLKMHFTNKLICNTPSNPHTDCYSSLRCKFTGEGTEVEHGIY